MKRWGLAFMLVSAVSPALASGQSLFEVTAKLTCYEGVESKIQKSVLQGDELLGQMIGTSTEEAANFYIAFALLDENFRVMTRCNHMPI